jgi:hypothetical protein
MNSRTYILKSDIKKKYFVANAFISQLNTQTMHTYALSQLHTRALLCVFP